MADPKLVRRLNSMPAELTYVDLNIRTPRNVRGYYLNSRGNRPATLRQLRRQARAADWWSMNLNNVNRVRERRSPKVIGRRRYAETVSLVESAQRTDRTLHRGLRADPTSFKRGVKLSLPESSWTGDARVVDMYATRMPARGGQPVVLHLPRGARATHIAPLTRYRNDEWVTPKARYAVSATRTKDGVKHVYLDQVGKAAGLTQDEHAELVRRKKRARRFAQTSGTLGLAALATRVPQGVKLATRHTPRLRVTSPVRRLIRVEPNATSTSNALTTLGAGTGAIGSFNFAGMQRTEAKAEEKHIRKASLSAVSRRAGRFFDERALRAARDLAPVGSPLANGAVVTGHNIRNRSFGLRSVRTEISRGGRQIGHVDTEMLPTKRAYVAGMGVEGSERGRGVGTSALHMLERNAPKSRNVRSVTWTAVGSKKPGASGGEISHGAYAWRHGNARYLPGVGVPRTASAKARLEALTPEQRKAAQRYIHRSKVGLARPGDLVSGSRPKWMDPTSAETVRGMAWWGGVKGGDRSHPVLASAAMAGGGATMRRRSDVEKSRGSRFTLADVLRNQDAMDDFSFDLSDLSLGGLGSTSTRATPKPAEQPKPKPEPKPKPAPAKEYVNPLIRPAAPKAAPAPKGRLRRVPRRAVPVAAAVTVLPASAVYLKRRKEREAEEKHIRKATFWRGMSVAAGRKAQRLGSLKAVRESATGDIGRGIYLTPEKHAATDYALPSGNGGVIAHSQARRFMTHGGKRKRTGLLVRVESGKTRPLFEGRRGDKAYSRARNKFNEKKGLRPWRSGDHPKGIGGYYDPRPGRGGGTTSYQQVTFDGKDADKLRVTRVQPVNMTTRERAQWRKDHPNAPSLFQWHQKRQASQFGGTPEERRSRVIAHRAMRLHPEKYRKESGTIYPGSFWDIRSPEWVPEPPNVRKSDDRFLRDYRDRISPKAEEKQLSKGLPSALRNSKDVTRVLDGTSRNGERYLLRRLAAHHGGRQAAQVHAWGRMDEGMGLMLSAQHERKLSRKLLNGMNRGVIAKRDDRFLRENRDRISPKAEEGYTYLRQGRNRYRRDAAVSGGLSAVNAGVAVHSAIRRRPVWAGAAGTLAALGGLNAYDSAKDARRWEGHMVKIRARAYQRARDGQYGKGRVGKAVRIGAVPVPRIPRMSYGTRVGGIFRRGSRTFTRRGSIVGTGRVRMP